MMGDVWGEPYVGGCDTGSKFVEAHNAMQRNIVTQSDKELLPLVGDNEILVGDAAAYRFKRDITSPEVQFPYLIFSYFAHGKYSWLS